MKNILFFATYPIGDKIIDGMAQRIHSIDEEFDRWHRTYIEIGVRRWSHRHIQSQFIPSRHFSVSYH